MTTMYNTTGYDPGAFLTNLKNTALQKYNQQMGASGGAADIAAKTASLPNPVFSRKYNPNPTGLDSLPITGQEILQGFNKINPMAMVIEKGINLPEINELEYQYGPGYTGKPSDARHMAAANNISNAVSNLIEKGSLGLVPESVSTFIGDATPNVAGGIKELISLGYNVLPTGDITPSEAIDMFKEDIAANYQGSFGIPQNTMTAKDIYEKVYSEPQEEINFSGLPIQVGSIYPSYFEDKEEFDRTGRGVYAGRPVYYSEGPDLPQGGLVYSGTAEDLENFYSSMQ
jgi:hypothetical protein